MVVKKGFNPPYINEFSESLLGGFYTKNEGEIADDVLARAAVAFSFGDDELAQRLYDAVWNGWFMFASPIISNAPEGQWTKKVTAEDWRSGESLLQYWDGDRDRGLPISCFSLDLADSVDGQLWAQNELAALSVAGGGVGIHNRIRATTKKAPGPIPFEKVIDASIGYWKQSSSRRGSAAFYMDVDHPDIVEHINFRVPTGGDRKRKADNLQQFHSAVNITDEFIQAVIDGSDFDLKCPHTGEVKDTVSARKLWSEILETRALTGEPYINKIDTVNRALPQAQKDLGLRVQGSNLCQSGDTLLLTDKGLRRIADLDGTSFNVLNGDGVYAPATAFVTAEEADVYELRLENGQRIKVTEDHIFEVRKVFGEKSRGYEYVEMKAKDMLGERVNALLGNDEGWSGKWYESDMLVLFGLIQGDGCFRRDSAEGDVKSVLFDNSEPEVVQFIIDTCYKLGYDVAIPESGGKFYLRDSKLISDLTDFGFKFSIIPERNMPSGFWALSSDGAKKFLKGLFSANGCAMPQYNRIAWLGTCEKLSEEVQDVLIALGFPAYRTYDGGREVEWVNGTYTGKPNFTVSTGSAWAFDKFQDDIGFLHIHKTSCATKTNRTVETHRSSKVKSITYVGKEKVYDFNEPVTHWGWANGFKIHNCNEIHLPTDEERTFVCCLSSLNLEKFDEWKDTTLVADLTRFLDNVIQWFIECASLEEYLKKAVFSAGRERAIGIGAMGWHRYLQSKGIPFESGGFDSSVQHTHKMFSLIKDQAVEASLNLGAERGEAPDMIGTGRRNSHLLAIAPNANSGVILNTSPCIEPESGVVYMQNTRAGTFRVVNPHFEALISDMSEEAREEIYQSIIHNDGSVQHLEFLTDEQKSVFKTAFEIDQHWVIEQADARQEHLCQGQSLNLFFPSGSNKDYFWSVHLKAITAPYIKGLYYARVRRGADTTGESAKQSEIVTYSDWKPEDSGECLACEG